MLSQLTEPKRQNRWTMSFEGIEAFFLKTSSRPQLAYEDTVVDYINSKFYFAGKATWEPITVTLLDAINPSSAQKVMEWLRLVYESNTGFMGYKDFYAKDFSLKMLGPVGEIVEEWQIVKAWPMSVNFGELDYAVSDLVNISVTFRFDRAELLF